MSREQCLLQDLYDKKIPRNNVFKAVMTASKRYTNKGRPHKGSGTSHFVPGQFNGTSEHPQILGDKHGFGTANCICDHKDFIKVVTSSLGVPIYFIHVYRNPYDVIAHMMKFYPRFGLPSTVKRVSDKFKKVHSAILGTHNLLSIKFEDLVSDTDNSLLRILGFLSLTPYKGYIKACTKIINPSVTKERGSLQWSVKDISDVSALCQSIPYLNDYSFD